jgi:single-strand selective monofunctional uracil DNA glycosylase
MIRVQAQGASPRNIPALLLEAADQLSRRLARLRFAAPVSHVYNPLVYARAPYQRYLERYAREPKQAVFLGMNPGPFGMAQTGVPFGEVAHVRDWLGIEAEVGRPRRQHPQRPITGFACARSEVSGARLWGLFRARYQHPERFFSWAFVANYCPLVFMEESGRNLTPDKLPARELAPLLTACDLHLQRVLELLQPRWVIGVGKFATARAQAVRSTNSAIQPAFRIASMPHPSPASPSANRDWGKLAFAALEEQGVLRDLGAPAAPLG